MTDLHALLVGVDRCLPERFPNDLPIPPLSGAVNDVNRVRRFLEEGPLAVPPERIRRLVSAHPWAAPVGVDPDELPTLSNLVSEIRALGERAAPGDQVLVHYSGHGARLPTAVPKIKGMTGRDECLVPCDAGAGEGRFLRDVELHALLDQLVSRGLLVTLVADCCHSGGVVRTGRAGRVRGLGDLPFPAPGVSHVGAWPELAAVWPVPRTEPDRPTWRRLDPDRGLLPMPEGCVLVAACRPNELAEERPFGGAFGGVLTHFLISALEGADAGFSYREIHRRVRSRVRSRGHRQTPALAGDVERAVLGRDRRPPGSSRAVEVDRFLIDPLEDRPPCGPELFRAVDRLVASPCGAGLAAAIEHELFALDRLESWWSPADRRPVDPASIPAETLLCLLLRNRSSWALEIAVLALHCDGGIERLHPLRGDGESDLLDPGAEQPVFFRGEIPGEAEAARDRVKVFVATGPMATDHLEQEAWWDVVESEGPPPLVSIGPSPTAEGEPPDGVTLPRGRAWAALSLDLTLRRPIRPPHSFSEPG